MHADIGAPNLKYGVDGSDDPGSLLAAEHNGKEGQPLLFDFGATTASSPVEPAVHHATIVIQRDVLLRFDITGCDKLMSCTAHNIVLLENL
jgi:hypothetical protein